MKTLSTLLLLCACLANTPNALADQFTKNLNYLTTNPQGQADTQTHAQSTYYNTQTQTTQLNKPKITLFAKHQQNWIITAEMGEIKSPRPCDARATPFFKRGVHNTLPNPNAPFEKGGSCASAAGDLKTTNELILLKNHIKLKNPTTNLTTTELTINPQTRELTTHTPITITANNLKEPLHAQAQTITYTQSTGEITLHHQATIQDSTHTLTGETLIYDTQKQTLLSSPNNGHNKGPITMVIQPNA